MISGDLMDKVNRITKDGKAFPRLRHLANEVDRCDAAALKKNNILRGRSILRIIAVHVTTREDHGQAYTYPGLMAITTKGEGKAADDDLRHFYDEWTRIMQEMERPHKTFGPSIQHHLYKQL